jgi:hypothetical protein
MSHPNDRHPQRPKWIDSDYQMCPTHPEYRASWRCKTCNVILCRDDMEEVAGGRLMHIPCGEHIATIR